MKLLKNKGECMKKWQKILIGFVYGVAIAAATDLFNYFIEKNMLNTFNVLLIELVFLGLGYLCAILESRFKETKKGKKK